MLRKKDEYSIIKESNETRGTDRDITAEVYKQTVTNLLLALVLLQRSYFSVSARLVHPVLLLLLLHLLHKTDLDRSY